MLQFSVPGEKNCGFTAKLFSVPDSTCVPSSQSLQVVHCIRVIAGKIAVFIAAARCTTQSPLLEGRYFPIDQLTDFVSVPLKFPHIAPKAFFPEARMVGYG